MRNGLNKLGAVLTLAAVSLLHAHAQVLISDDYNVAGSGSGFALNNGVNSSINPPTTRLSGTVATNLRYIVTETAKTNTAYSISGSKLRVTSATGAGRFTFSANGTTPYNFASAFGSTAASPLSPVVYDLSVSMANNSAGTQRFSFALSTVDGDATTWDFGIQLYRGVASDNHYTIGKRIDTTASGLAVDSNFLITNTAAGTFGSEINFLIRVTDAGAETTTFNSRVQVSMDGGFSWFYDTASDPDLPNGWRFDGAGRYIIWDIAPSAGPVTYDNLLVVPVPISAKLLAPADGALNIGASPSLNVAVSNTAPSAVSVTYYGREAGKPYPGRDFLIAVLPDTQNYAREASGSGNATKEMWFAQTDWIATNRVPQNIAYVATLGDCVQNAGVHTEWRNATNAMYRLESPTTTKLRDGIPYGVTVGNHDQEPAGDENGATTYYNQYFGTAHFQDKSYYGGHFSTNNDTWFDLFSAGGMDFIVFSFEYGRYGSAVLDWAEDVLATNQNRRVIVLTHHAGDDNADVNATTTSHSAQGAAIYERLKTNPNFFLMLGGHVFNEGGEGRRSDTFNGRTVRTLVSDYQGRFNGGNGLMRLMYFSPSNNLVSVKTFSPYTGQYETDANSEFTFSYNMQPPTGPGSPGTPYVALGTNAAVAPGAQSSFAWSGLQANKTYEWYVKLTDEAGNTWISPARRFTTTVNTAPVASARNITIPGDQASDLQLIGTDGNGDALTFLTNSRPIRGLNIAFSAANGTVRYQPAHGYRGLDRFTYSVTDGFATSAVVNFDLNIVAPADANTNGLPDSWEAAYGISDPNADADGDGVSNLAEYIANTDPTNAASLFKILGVDRDTNGAVSINWSSIGGTRYRVQIADDGTNGSVTAPFQDLLRPIELEMDPNPHGVPSTLSFLDPDSGGSTNKARYYRLKVAP